MRDFRIYFIGHFVSVAGLWMQRIAQSWLVLELTGSGAAMGMVTALQFVPIWFVAPFGGLIADRVSRKLVLLTTNMSAGAIALTLGLLVTTGRVELWMIFVLAILLGVVGAIDNPTRQAFINEIVGPERLTNAIGLNMVLVNIARIVGPALAGFLIVSVGIGACFLVDAGTYVGMIVALLLIRTGRRRDSRAVVRMTGQIREGLRYAWRHRELRTPLLMLTAISALAYQFEVTVPLLAKYTFDGSADLFGIMFAFMGVGAAAGGMYSAARVRRPARSLSNMMIWGSVALAICGLAPNLTVAMLGLVAVGAIMTAFLVEANSAVQLASPGDLLGRVLGIHALALLGVRPLFSPLMGWIGETAGPRIPFILGSVAALTTALVSRSPLVAEGSADNAVPVVADSPPER